MKHTAFACTLVATIIALTVASVAVAQAQDFPSRPIKISFRCRWEAPRTW